MSFGRKAFGRQTHTPWKDTLSAKHILFQMFVGLVPAGPMFFDQKAWSLLNWLLRWTSLLATLVNIFIRPARFHFVQNQPNVWKCLSNF